MPGRLKEAQKIKIAQRRSRALDMRILGASYRAIASKLSEEFDIPKYSYSLAAKDVAAALAEINQANNLKAEDYRELEQQRLDRAMSAIAGQVRAGDVQAIDKWVKISESRRKLLGLDAPVQVQVSSMVESELNGFFSILESQLQPETFREVLTAFDRWQDCQAAAATN